MREFEHKIPIKINNFNITERMGFLFNFFFYNGSMILKRYWMREGNITVTNGDGKGGRNATVRTQRKNEDA